MTVAGFCELVLGITVSVRRVSLLFDRGGVVLWELGVRWVACKGERDGDGV